MATKNWTNLARYLNLGGAPGRPATRPAATLNGIGIAGVKRNSRGLVVATMMNGTVLRFTMEVARRTMVATDVPLPPEEGEDDGEAPEG